MYVLANLANECSSPALSQLVKIFKNVLSVVQIIGPILLILSLAFTFTKLMNNPDEKKYKNLIKNEIIALLFVFFIPIVVNASMYLLDDTFSISACWNSTGKYSVNSTYISTTDDEKKGSVVEDSSNYQEGNERVESNTESSSSNNSATATGTGNFTKYNMTDDQIKQMTAICIHEQGTAKGAAAEASLMANRFELYGASYGSGASGLIAYVKGSGWFANAASHMADTGVVTTDAYNAVKSVLVDGKRTLPGYIDEHDCLSDISSVSNNGSSFSVSDRNSYIGHTTIIHNRYGSTYTFYSFPDSGSDPFGYTSESNRSTIGDNCYSYGS